MKRNEKEKISKDETTAYKQINFKISADNFSIPLTGVKEALATLDLNWVSNDALATLASAQGVGKGRPFEWLMKLGRATESQISEMENYWRDKEVVMVHKGKVRVLRYKKGTTVNAR
jgi:hypothetical protein